MKYIRFTVLLCLLAVLLPACVDTNIQAGSTPTAIPSSSCTPAGSSGTIPTSTTAAGGCQAAGPWLIDKDHHWRICKEHGEKLEFQKHEVQDELCATCNTMIRVTDGCTALRQLDHFGVIVLDMVYDENGVLVTKDHWDIAYDLYGNLIGETYYEMDIKKYTKQYNAAGVLTHDITFAPDGTVAESRRYEFSYNQIGQLSGQKNYLNEELVYEVSYIYSGQDRLTSAEITYAEDRTKTAKYYTYDAFGTLLTGTGYTNDVLTYKHEYKVYSQQVGPFQQEIITAVRIYTYNSDGSYSLKDYLRISDGYCLSAFNEAAEELSREYFDKEGNPMDRPAQYEVTTCAPLFGTWECTYTLTAADMGVMLEKDASVQLHLSMTFDKFGELSVKWSVDKDAYYTFLVRVEEERLLQEKMSTGMTRKEAMDFYYAQGTSALDIAMEKVGKIEDHMPDDGIYFYYLDNGVLYYTMGDSTSSASIVIGDKSLILRGEDNQQEFVLSKKA